MAENSGQKTPPLRLEFEYRRAAGGGLSDTIILSPETKRSMKSLLNTSRSGKHGKRVYFLVPGKKYVKYEVIRSGSGNIFISVSEIMIKDDGTITTLQEWTLFKGDVIETLPDQLPSDLMSLLLDNQKELPLFNEYMKQVIHLSSQG